MDTTKVHDILDDLQSLYWVILYIAVRYFKFTGEISAAVFDEYSLQLHPVLGLIVCGGQVKRSWLTSSPLVFECKALSNFLKDYLVLHSKYQTVIDDAEEDEEKKLELKLYRDSIEEDVYSLVSYFDAVLDAPETDWNNCAVNGTKSERRSAEEERKLMNSILEKAICKLNDPIDEADEDSENQDAELKPKEGRGSKKGTAKGKKRSRKGPGGSSRCRRKVNAAPEDNTEDGEEI